MTDNSLRAEAPEPLLITGMRTHPTGDVCHFPDARIGAGGTTTRQFLAEFDAYVASLKGDR